MVETQPDYRPQGGIGFDEWWMCWAQGEKQWDICGRPGNRLGLCDEHYAELRGA